MGNDCSTIMRISESEPVENGIIKRNSLKLTEEEEIK